MENAIFKHEQETNGTTNNKLIIIISENYAQNVFNTINSHKKSITHENFVFTHRYSMLENAFQNLTKNNGLLLLRQTQVASIELLSREEVIDQLSMKYAIILSKDSKLLISKMSKQFETLKDEETRLIKISEIKLGSKSAQIQELNYLIEMLPQRKIDENAKLLNREGWLKMKKLIAFDDEEVHNEQEIVENGVDFTKITPEQIAHQKSIEEEIMMRNREQETNNKQSSLEIKSGETSILQTRNINIREGNETQKLNINEVDEFKKIISGMDKKMNKILGMLERINDFEIVEQVIANILEMEIEHKLSTSKSLLNIKYDETTDYLLSFDAGQMGIRNELSRETLMSINMKLEQNNRISLDKTIKLEKEMDDCNKVRKTNCCLMTEEIKRRDIQKQRDRVNELLEQERFLTINDQINTNEQCSDADLIYEATGIATNIFLNAKPAETIELITDDNDQIERNIQEEDSLSQAEKDRRMAVAREAHAQILTMGNSIMRVNDIIENNQVITNNETEVKKKVWRRGIIEKREYEYTADSFLLETSMSKKNVLKLNSTLKYDDDDEIKLKHLKSVAAQCISQMMRNKFIEMYHTNDKSSCLEFTDKIEKLLR